MKIITVIAALLIGCMAYGDTTARAVELLKGLEGFRPSVYKCEAGRATIGYGFTSKVLTAKGTMTEEEASAELKRLCEGITLRLRSELGKGNILSPSQEAAVVSFVYNVGWTNFRNSTLCRYLKAGRRGLIVGNEFRKWVYVTKGGKKVVSKGLLKRRLKEMRAFLCGW